MEKISRLHKHVKLEEKTYKRVDKKQLSRRQMFECSPWTKCKDVSEGEQGKCLETSVLSEPEFVPEMYFHFPPLCYD